MSPLSFQIGRVHNAIRQEMARLMSNFGPDSAEHYFTGHLIAAPPGLKNVIEVTHPNVRGAIRSMLYIRGHFATVINIAHSHAFRVKS